MWMLEPNESYSPSVPSIPPTSSNISTSGVGMGVAVGVACSCEGSVCAADAGASLSLSEPNGQGIVNNKITSNTQNQPRLYIGFLFLAPHLGQRFAPFAICAPHTWHSFKLFFAPQAGHFFSLLSNSAPQLGHVTFPMGSTPF